MPKTILMENVSNPEKSLPKGWRWVRLGEICEEKTGTRDPRLTPNKHFYYVDISSIDNKTKRIADPKKLFGRDAPSRARQVVHIGDVIVSTTRPNLNAVAFVPKELDKQICSTGFCVLRSGKQLNSDFLFAFVQSHEFVENLSSLVKGALYPAVTDSQVHSQTIPLPPLSEQKCIAAILTEQIATVEKARIAGETELEAVEALPASYLREIFNSPEAKEWPRKRLGDVFRMKSGEPLSVTGMKSGRFPVYGGNGINGYHDKYIFREPKIVIGRVGAYCGCVHVS